MFRSFLLALVAVFGLSGPALADPPPSAARYAAPDMFSDVALSPSGKLVAMVGQKDSRAVLRVYDADRVKDGPKAEYVLGPAPRVRWIRWKTDNWLLVSVGVPDGSLGQVLEQSRLMSVDPGLKTFVNLGRAPRGKIALPETQDRVASFLPDDPSSVLVQIDWRTPVHPSLRKVNIRTAESTLVRDRDMRVTGWLVDADARPRLAVGDFTKSVADYFVVGADGALAPVTPKLPKEATFVALGFDRTPSRLVVASNHEGGVAGLYIYDLDRQVFGERLFKDDSYDVSGAVYGPDGRSVVGASFVNDQHEVVYFDPGYVKKVERARVLVGGDRIAVLDATPDGDRMIVARRENGRLVETWWVDLAAGQARSFGRFNPALDAAETGKVFPIRYKARDGLAIPGYVTLPPGIARLEDAKGLPFVVMPHGGPHARDSAEYDWWSQFLASRGYGVFQPNYRGSTGYGGAFEEAGRGQWGQAIQNDVSDGARWLVSQSYADKDRMCIVGGSFGGYTALVAAYLNADQYRCAVSLAGVADLNQLIQEERLYYGGDKVMRELMGELSRSPSAMRSYSPADNAARMSIPVLVVQGTADWTVPVRHGRVMRDRLKSAKRPYTYLELELADHSLSREKDRLAFLQAMDGFIASAIGPGAALRP